MRLTSFSLENYGNFANARLTLDPQPRLPQPHRSHRRTQLQGQNSAAPGLPRPSFGISGQTKMAFRYGYLVCRRGSTRLARPSDSAAVRASATLWWTRPAKGCSASASGWRRAKYRSRVLREDDCCLAVRRTFNAHNCMDCKATCQGSDRWLRY